MNFKNAFQIIGIDEVGMGPWAGPVVSVAAVLSPTLPKVYYPFIQDSKKLSAKKRQVAWTTLRPYLYIGIGYSLNRTVDTLGLRKATNMAMVQAYINLPTSIAPYTHIWIDGIYMPPEFQHMQNLQVHTAVKGDTYIPAIAAASIVAKCFRDHYMIQHAHKYYPQYGFDAHKGYGTKQHKQALEKFGICPLHRTSYAPIQRVLRTQPIALP